MTPPLPRARTEASRGRFSVLRASKSISSMMSSKRTLVSTLVAVLLFGLEASAQAATPNMPQSAKPSSALPSLSASLQQKVAASSLRDKHAGKDDDHDGVCACSCVLLLVFVCVYVCMCVFLALSLSLALSLTLSFSLPSLSLPHPRFRWAHRHIAHTHVQHDTLTVLT